ncbi:MAG: F0F1 ATP synthase subunit delta [Planctomycetota bacterium]|nr:F0F1 ATP synthase subunit delta [Planctomycetota bacterium]
MIVDAVTARWAGALYGLAAKQGVLSTVVADVERLGVEFARPEVRRVLQNPRIDAATRRGAVAACLRGAHVLTQNFVGLALDRGREEVLVGLSAAFRRRILLDAGQVEGFVETARPIDPADLARVASDFGRLLGQKLILKNRVVPELIGGARVIAGNRMLDGSVSGRLEGLRRRLQEVQLPG